jgi:hypothetical protein
MHEAPNSAVEDSVALENARGSAAAHSDDIAARDLCEDDEEREPWLDNRVTISSTSIMRPSASCGTCGKPTPAK